MEHQVDPSIQISNLRLRNFELVMRNFENLMRNFAQRFEKTSSITSAQSVWYALNEVGGALWRSKCSTRGWHRWRRLPA